MMQFSSINPLASPYHIIRFAFDSADDLLLIGEDLIELRKANKKVNPEKFLAYVRTKTVDGETYYLLPDIESMLKKEHLICTGCSF